MLESLSQRRFHQCIGAEVTTACISMYFKRKTAGNLQMVVQCHPGASMVIVKLIIQLFRDLVHTKTNIFIMSQTLNHPGKEMPLLNAWRSPCWNAVTPHLQTYCMASSSPWGRWHPAQSALHPQPMPAFSLGTG